MSQEQICGDDEFREGTLDAPAAAPMGFLRELWAFLCTRKRFWLMPIILALLLLALLMVIGTHAGVVSPIIYAL